MNFFDSTHKNICKKHINFLRSIAQGIPERTTSNISNHQFSKEILSKMYYYYLAQDKYKDWFGRGLKYAGADYFEDVVAASLKRFVGSKYKVFVEKSYTFKRKAKRALQIRPDISVEYKGNPIYVLELKTQLGRNRIDWKRDWKKRKKQLCKLLKLSKKKVILVILTGANWDSNIKLDDDIIILSRLWPEKPLNQLLTQNNFIGYIEPLYKKILNSK